LKIDSARTRVPSEKLNNTKSFSYKDEGISIFTEKKKGEFYYIKIDNLIPFKKQSRKRFDIDSIRMLALTIKEHGIRQPLTIVKSKDSDKFEIVSGERRYLAAKMNLMEKVPCIILQDYKMAEEIALIENIQREDLNPIELGDSYKILYESGYYATQMQIAEKLGVSRTQVTEYMKLASLNPNIKKLLIKNNFVDRNFLRKIMSLQSDEERLSFIENKISKKTFSSKLKKKSNIINIFLNENNLLLKIQDLSQLNKKNKIRLKNILEDIILKIED